MKRKLITTILTLSLCLSCFTACSFNAKKVSDNIGKGNESDLPEAEDVVIDDKDDMYNIGDEIDVKTVEYGTDREYIEKCYTVNSVKLYDKGVNGSGKTMLMRAVSGLMYPTSGTISIDGKVLGKNMAFPERIGMLIENPAFIDSYTGYDNLKMLASINKGEVDISRALETVGLNPHDKRKYRKYSLGMKQRLGIACAIMEEPKLLLLDEPFNALDKEGQEKLSEIIRDMRDKGSLILLSSHDKDELENLSDVIYLVDSGRFKLK